LLLADQSGFQSLLYKPLAHLLDGGAVDLDGLGDTGVGPGRPAGGGIGLEEDTSVRQFQGSGLAGRNQSVQELAFIGCKRNLVLLHGGNSLVPLKNRDAAALGKSKLSGY
jgi:hypothetical protein